MSLSIAIVVAGLLAAYLLGSIPTGFLLAKVLKGIDIREHGSGSASHLNVSRIMGPNFSLIVRVLDLSKGFLAANFAFFRASLGALGCTDVTGCLISVGVFGAFSRG